MQLTIACTCSDHPLCISSEATLQSKYNGMWGALVHIMTLTVGVEHAMLRHPRQLLGQDDKAGCDHAGINSSFCCCWFVGLGKLVWHQWLLCICTGCCSQ